MTIPIRALIVDDEPLARRGIRARLARAGGFEIVAERGTGRAAIDAIRRLEPDLVFLDVQMPELDGFDVIEHVGPAHMPLVVFVTAYDTHALRAFDVHAIDYVLKPIDDERFDQTLERVRERVADRQHGALSRQLTSLLAARHAHLDRIPVKDRGRIVLVDPSELEWVEADGDYVRLHTRERSHLLRETMAAMERRLDAARFVRIHRSTIVNAACIRELRQRLNGEYDVLLRSGRELRSSRSYADRLRAITGDAP